jgi:hypothetical protein
MSIKSRVEKLEEGLPERDSGIKLLWKSVVRRDGLLIERPVCATIVRLPDAPNETLMWQEAGGQATFLARVLDTVRHARGRERR